MDNMAGYRSLARAVLSRAAIDSRLPIICTRCGKRSKLPDRGRLLRERKMAYTFLRDRSGLYSAIVGITTEVVRAGARKEARKRQLICACDTFERDKECKEWKVE